jgi:GT2 family glycosyltransferase
MKRFDDLTIATTVHNNFEMSAAMLSSFEANVGLAAEISLVDDASSPSRPLPSTVAPIKVIRADQPSGFCKASDLALRQVRTKYALLVDADVLFDPGDFEAGYIEFRKAEWAWVNFRQVSFGGQPQNSYEQPLMPPWVFAGGNQVLTWWQQFHRNPGPSRPGQRIVPVEAVHSSCTLVDMDAFRAVGGFDPWYWQCQSDVDLSLRLRKGGYGVGVDLGYTVRHDGAGGKGGGATRVLDLYRSRVHLYEHAYPASRFYLRPLLFVRHLAEVVWFAIRALFKRDTRLRTRIELLKGVLQGYH